MFETRVKALNDLRRNLKDEGWYYDKSCPGRVGFGADKNVKIAHIYILFENHIFILRYEKKVVYLLLISH